VSRWREQVAPVLEALGAADAHDLHERGLFLGYGNSARERLGVDLDDRAVHEALLLLRDENHVAFEEEPESTNSVYIQNLEVTGKGQEALGGWPRFNMLLTPSTLGALLDVMAEQAESEDERTLLRRAADYARSLPGPMLLQAGVTVSVQLVRVALGWS
jgi:hypothetical protein